MTWRRPTLPRLKTQYHWRGGFSRPSSEWDRVRAPRHDHQVIYEQDFSGLSSPIVRWRARCTVARTPAGFRRRPGTTCERFLPSRFECLLPVGDFLYPLGLCRYLYLYEWIKPIERLVPVSFTCYHASTPGLSTWWSTTVLGETWF